MDDLENRSKRNNIVLWNIPEGSEKSDIVGFLYDFLQPIWTYTLLRTICIDRAHQSGKKSSDKPMPIDISMLEY